MFNLCDKLKKLETPAISGQGRIAPAVRDKGLACPAQRGAQICITYIF